MVPTGLSALRPGDVLLCRFRIVRWLGNGGMGDVYEALDAQLSETVALKRIRPDMAEYRHPCAIQERGAACAPPHWTQYLPYP